MTLRARVLAVCALAVVGLGLTSALFFTSVDSLGTRSERAREERAELAALQHLAALTGDALSGAADALEHRTLAPIERAVADIEGALVMLRRLTPEPAEQAAFAALESGAVAVIAALRQALVSHGGDQTRTMRALADLAKAEVFIPTQWLIDDELDDAATSETRADEALATLRTLAVVLPLGLLGLLALGALAFLPRFTRGVHTLQHAARRMAAGELDTTVALTGDDELARVGVAFNAMSTTLRDARAELVRAREQAEQSDRLKSEFLANMSHEIRTPMHGVLGLTDLLAVSELTPAQREQVALLRASGEAMLHVLDGVLDFSKIEAGRDEVRARPFGLAALLGELVKSMAARGDERGVEVVLAVRHDVPDALVGDDVKLRQIVVNLVHNALKFTQVGDVRVEVTVASWLHERVELELRVSDTGIGIPPERRDAIFEAFTQADGSITRRYGGTGLGLAIVSRLVRLLGGSVALASELGQGATFTVRLPFALAPRQPVPSSDVAALLGLRALIVDDHAATRAVLADQLRSLGMVVEQHADQAGAVLALGDERARRSGGDGRPFAVALVDVALPHDAGLELVRHLARDPSVATIPLLSPSRAAAQIGPCRAAGVFAWVTKPALTAELASAIGRARRREELTPSAQAQPASAPQPQPLRILAAEDNPVNQHVLVAVLGRRGHAVTVVGNGLEAVERARAERWDILVMDVQMPEMDGLAAAASIRAHEATAGGRVPILGMTAHTQASDRDRCFESGMDAFIAKPVGAKELVETVERFAR